MGVLNGPLTKIIYKEIKDFEENSHYASQLPTNYIICDWDKFPWHLNIKERFIMCPRDYSVRIKDIGIDINDIGWLLDGSYYELILHLMEKTIKNTANLNFVFTYLHYFKQFYKLLSDRNIATSTLPVEIIELLVKEEKNFAIRRGEPEPQLKESDYETCRENMIKVYGLIINQILRMIVSQKSEWVDQFLEFALDNYYLSSMFLPKAKNYEIFIEGPCNEELRDAAKIRKEFQITIEQLPEQEKQCIEFLSKLQIGYSTTTVGMPLNEKRSITCECQLFSGKYQLHIPDVLRISNEAETVIAYYTYQAMLEGKVMFKSWCTPSEFAHLVPNHTHHAK